MNLLFRGIRCEVCGIPYEPYEWAREIGDVLYDIQRSTSGKKTRRSAYELTRVWFQREHPGKFAKLKALEGQTHTTQEGTNANGGVVRYNR